MSRNHLYFLSSNIPYSRYLNEDDEIEDVSDYPYHEYQKTSPYEWGRIKTKSNYFHLLLGNPSQKGCPWCGSEPFLKKIPSLPSCIMEPLEFSRYCLQCQNCGASGPIMNVLPEKEMDEVFMKEVKDLMIKRFKSRRSWEFDFEGLNRE